MAHFIDKDAVVAEIEEIIADENESIKCFEHRKNVSEVKRSNARICILMYIRSFLDTLEVKETNLEKYLKENIEDILFDLDGVAVKGATHYLTVEDVKDIAKHFFELGLNESNPLTWEDIKEICVQSVLVEIDLGGKVSDERHYTEVLKRFKAQKGK